MISLSQTASADERSNESKVPIIATLGEPPMQVFRQLLADLAGTQQEPRLHGARGLRNLSGFQPTGLNPVKSRFYGLLVERFFSAFRLA